MGVAGTVAAVPLVLALAVASISCSRIISSRRALAALVACCLDLGAAASATILVEGVGKKKKKKKDKRNY